MDLPNGALRLTDTGYFDLQRLSQLDKRGVYWLSRLPASVHIWHEDGASLSLSHFLNRQAQADIDQVVY